MSALQGRRHFSQKSKTERGKMGLLSKGTTQIHFISGTGGI
jgi:hypothetical protein